MPCGIPGLWIFLRPLQKIYDRNQNFTWPASSGQAKKHAELSAVFMCLNFMQRIESEVFAQILNKCNHFVLLTYFFKIL